MQASGELASGGRERGAAEASENGRAAFRRAADRVLARCGELSLLTDEPGTISRSFLSAAAADAQSRVAGWFGEAGLNVLIDPAGNVVGHRRAASESAPDSSAGAGTFVIGSHLDTVPESGSLDGVLGVLAGLEAVAMLGDQPMPIHVDVVGTSEEGGTRFGLPYTGSRALTGALPDDVLNRRDRHGQSVAAAIDSFGLDPAQLTRSAYGPDRLLGYLELHIEQGPVLHKRDLPLGIVSAIHGQSRILLAFEGQAGHAGTVPMDQRRDALVAAARMIVEAQDYGRSIAGLRATVGQINVEPNARNVVPGRVVLSVDVRHDLDEIREIAVEALIQLAQNAAAENGLQWRVVDLQATPAVTLDPDLQRRLAAAAADCRVAVGELPSGSGHDAVIFARRCPAAMLMLRQRDDLTDRAAEAIDPDDLADAIRVLHRCLLRLPRPAPDIVDLP